VLHERILEHMRVFSVGGYYGDTLEQVAVELLRDAFRRELVGWRR